MDPDSVPEKKVPPTRPSGEGKVQSRRKRETGSPAEKQMWRAVAERLASAIDDEDLRNQLLENASHPREIEAFIRLLATHPPRGSSQRDAVKQFFAFHDDSDASLSKWMEALAELQAWIEAQGRRTTLKMAVGYLACCDAAVMTRPDLHDLPATVRQMLDEYGFDG